MSDTLDRAEPDPIPDPCVACVRNARSMGRLCAGCYWHTDGRLTELAERWPLMRVVLLEPSSTVEQRVSGSRERPLPGGDVLSLTGPGRLHVSEWPPGLDRDQPVPGRLLRHGWRPAWQPTLDPPPADGTCPATTTATRTADGHTWTEKVHCTLRYGHVRRHREHDQPDAWSWPHQPLRVVWRTPLLDEYGQPVLRPPGDQHGDIDPVERLWSWVRDWCATRRAGENGPTPDLPSVTGWLRNRLGWAAEAHPAVDDFVTEVRSITDTMRLALNVKRYVQRFSEPCPRCDVVALFREIDPDRDPHKAWVECGNCANLWQESEFSRLGVILEGEARTRHRPT